MPHSKHQQRSRSRHVQIAVAVITGAMLTVVLDSSTYCVRHDDGKTSKDTADFVSGSARGVTGVPPRSI
jgi:hypothetical protein